MEPTSYTVQRSNVIALILVVAVLIITITGSMYVQPGLQTRIWDSYPNSEPLRVSGADPSTAGQLIYQQLRLEPRISTFLAAHGEPDTVQVLGARLAPKRFLIMYAHSGFGIVIDPTEDGFTVRAPMQLPRSYPQDVGKGNFGSDPDDALAASRSLAPTTRIAGARLPAFHSAAPLSTYVADPDLLLVDIDVALQGKTLGARIVPFTQYASASAPTDANVEHGGELVALAIAKQLERIGWRVTVEEDAAKEGLGWRVTKDPAENAIVGPQSTPDAGQTDCDQCVAYFRIVGDVRFTAGSSLADGHLQARTILDTRVVFNTAAESRVVFAGSFHEEDTVTPDDARSRTDIVRDATEMALRGLIWQLFTDPSIQRLLIAELAK